MATGRPHGRRWSDEDGHRFAGRVEGTRMSEGQNMKKQILIGAGALVLVAVPAVIGLWGNASFAQSVPVRVPSSGQVVTPVPTPPAVSPSPSPSIDDNGGDVPRDQRTEPGDDRDVNGTGSTGTAPGDTVAPVDDNG